MVYKPGWMREWLENSEATIQFMDHKVRERMRAHLRSITAREQ